jgi:serine protease Do
VEANTPAHNVLQKNDIIARINGETIDDCDRFVSIVGSARVDQPTRIDLYREGKALSVEVKLRQRQLPSVAVHRENQRFRWRGMLLGPIPTNWDFGTEPKPQAGLMVLAVQDNSPAVQQGITAGTVITSVAGKTVAAIKDLQAIINDTPEERCSIELATTSSTVASIRE